MDYKHNIMGFSFKLLAVILFMVVNTVVSTKDKDLLLKVPEECKDRRYCSIKPEGYEKLEKKINNALPSFLITELTDRYSANDENITDPFPEKNDDNCQYEVKMEQMYMYYKGENNTKTEIIIQTDLFKQQVKTVNCIYVSSNMKDTNVQCFQKLLKKPYNKKTTCVESKAKRILYVYDIDKDKVVPKSFEVPVCCSCQVENIT